MAFKLNPITGQLDLTGSAAALSVIDKMILRTISTDTTIPSGYTWVHRDTILVGNLTIENDGELYVL